MKNPYAKSDVSTRIIRQLKMKKKTTKQKTSKMYIVLKRTYVDIPRIRIRCLDKARRTVLPVPYHRSPNPIDQSNSPQSVPIDLRASRHQQPLRPALRALRLGCTKPFVPKICDAKPSIWPKINTMICKIAPLMCPSNQIFGKKSAHIFVP